MANEQRVVFQTDGISCYIGDERINTGLGYTDGVIGVISSCSDNTVVVDYDSDITNPDKIAEVLKEMEFNIID